MKREYQKAADAALAAFDDGWKSAARKYVARRINSEACLQAAIYEGMAPKLPENFFVYVAAKVEFPNRRAHPDILVVYRDRIVLAAELKYKPNVYSRPDIVMKDIDKLGAMRPVPKAGKESGEANEDDGQEQSVKVELKRINVEKGQQKPSFIVSRHMQIVFGAFAREGKFPTDAAKFWTAHKVHCKDARWSKRKVTPPRLAIRICETESDGSATPMGYGGVRVTSWQGPEFRPPV